MAHLVKSQSPAPLARARPLAYNACAATASRSIVLPESAVVVPTTAGARLQSSLDQSELAIDSSHPILMSPTERLSQDYEKAEATIEPTVDARDAIITVR